MRLDVFDVLVGINLLREGLDIPEIELVAILDADKEGFLRSETSLIQTIGRAARNAEGHVVMYADKMTDSMKKALDETERRRKIQKQYNEEHGITPQTIKKAVWDLIRISSKADNEGINDNKDPESMSKEELQKSIAKIMKKMNQAATELNFERRTKALYGIFVLLCQAVSGTDGKTGCGKFEGLPPAISIDQKSTNRNPRSTVGTVTEVYD